LKLWIKPNPPTPFPAREGGVVSPLSLIRRGVGGEVFMMLKLTHIFKLDELVGWVSLTLNPKKS
uniref:hypothetical protein n=1 Tax=Okeania sp. SIO2F4 TaxID=2607790 RepID=UPI0025D96EBA